MTGMFLIAAEVVFSICAVFINAHRRDRTATVVWLIFGVILFCAASAAP